MNFVFITSLYPLLGLASFDPALLRCTLQDENLSSVISFSRTTAQGLSGELDNYSLKGHGQKQFLSGSVFFDLTFSETKISGHTGDPRGEVSNFSLTRSGTNPTGTWKYEGIDREGDRDRAQFDCVYDDDRN